ncbi:hypothetical protein KPH14_004257 [Odynerus spinipes]|uniref:Cyclic nucleotide-binding domain-containing protein n=1 Tax=Odynerus spinipes TaxID=1348599 RepID=A0AAD9RYC8_9HYME|nr:hypothetical protein KPH14_004257 [Odynerus spinipes]
MSLYFRKASLRKSFSAVLSRRSLFRIRTNKLRGRYFFRAMVRLVLEYIDWLTEKPALEEISDDVAANLRLTEEKKVEKKALTIERLRAFRKYPEELRQSLAGVCLYQYIQRDRVIVRQGHIAQNLYLIVNGEVGLTRVVTDDLTGETEEVDMGSMHPGDMFGEIALLHRIPRTATIVTKTSVDLLVITLDDFNEILRDKLTKEWNVLQDAVVHFNYFKTWDDETIRECCILSRLKHFNANEVLLGDGKGLVNYVHFILEGECRLIEHMLVKEEPSHHGMRYKLIDSETISSTTIPQIEKEDKGSGTGKAKGKGSKTDGEQVDRFDNEEIDLDDAEIDYSEIALSRRSAPKNVDIERMSIVTATLLDVVNEWHGISDVAEMLMREPSITAHRYPKDIRTIFMQVCMFYRGACFGLGEKMRNRRIVSVTPVRCFLIPRYWLMEHNRANIWQRVRLFMDSKFPSEQELFKEFIRSRKWVQYKRKLVNDIITRGRRSRNCATIHDVPYSIRITEEIDPKL